MTDLKETMLYYNNIPLIPIKQTAKNMENFRYGPCLYLVVLNNYERPRLHVWKYHSKNYEQCSNCYEYRRVVHFNYSIRRTCFKCNELFDIKYTNSFTHLEIHELKTADILCEDCDPIYTETRLSYGS